MAFTGQGRRSSSLWPMTTATLLTANSGKKVRKGFCLQELQQVWKEKILSLLNCPLQQGLIIHQLFFAIGRAARKRVFLRRFQNDVVLKGSKGSNKSFQNHIQIPRWRSHHPSRDSKLRSLDKIPKKQVTCQVVTCYGKHSIKHCRVTLDRWNW